MVSLAFKFLISKNPDQERLWTKARAKPAGGSLSPERKSSVFERRLPLKEHTEVWVSKQMWLSEVLCGNEWKRAGKSKFGSSNDFSLSFCPILGLRTGILKKKKKCGLTNTCIFPLMPGMEPKVLHILDKHSNMELHPQPFAKMFSLKRVPLGCPGWAWICDSPASASWVTRITGECHPPSLATNISFPPSYCCQIL